jgi:hypothetical protein
VSASSRTPGGCSARVRCCDFSNIVMLHKVTRLQKKAIGGDEHHHHQHEQKQPSTTLSSVPTRLPWSAASLRSPPVGAPLPPRFGHPRPTPEHLAALSSTLVSPCHPLSLLCMQPQPPLRRTPAPPPRAPLRSKLRAGKPPLPLLSRCASSSSSQCAPILSPGREDRGRENGRVASSFPRPMKTVLFF